MPRGGVAGPPWEGRIDSVAALAGRLARLRLVGAAGCAGGSPPSPTTTARPVTPGRPATRRSAPPCAASSPPRQPARQAAALTSAELKRLLASCGTDVAGLRDRALLLVGFAGALRRSELVGDRPRAPALHRDRAAVLIPRSKTRPGGGGGRARHPPRANPPPVRCGRWKPGSSARASSGGRCSGG